MSGLFSILNTGDLGMQAMQSALDVTSHNVANADTTGYTRETVNLQALAPTNPSLDASSANEVGTGVTVQDISRIRDALNDYQVRQATSANSTLTNTSNYLSQIQTIMNEPSDTGISSLIGTFFSDWSSVATDATTGSSARTTLVQGTQTLTDTLNNVYNQLQNLKTDCQTSIQSQIVNANTQLNETDELNQQIIDVSSNGGTPNDLMDQRDLLLDNLSQSFDITTTSGNQNGITLTVPQTTIPSTTAATNATLIAQTDPTSTTDPSSESRLAYISDISGPAADGSYDITYYKNGDTSSAANKVTLNVTGLSSDEESQLEESRVLVTNEDGTITGAGSVSTNADGSTDASIDISSGSGNTLTTLNSTDGVLEGLTQSQQSIDNYTDQLNTVAKAIALAVNTVESGTTDATGDTNPFFVNSSAATYDTDSSGNVTLDSNYTDDITDNEAAITAGNISVNTAILDNPNAIQAGSGTTGSGDGTRALAIANLGNLNLDIQDMSATDGRTYFAASDTDLVADSNGISTLPASSNGTTFSNYFTSSITNLGEQTSQAQQQLTNQTAVLNSLTQTRTSTSGVSTDEEMTNLIQYQHAYEANAKIISTVDELLGVVINNLKTS
jgi:flagellar hook-associated protein 1 FlgK